MQKIGLIAGNRRFPILFSQAAKKKNVEIIAAAVKGDTSRELSKYVNKIYWFSLSEFSKLFDYFKSENVTQVVMAGQISPRRLFSKEIEKDAQLKNLLDSIKDKRADTIFGAIAQKLADNGIELLDSTIFLGEYMPKKGVLTVREPSFDIWEDVAFGFKLAKEIAGLDIGQTVAVKNKAIVAVEAFEGTDNLIRRAGVVGRAGVTVVKVAKPKQDLRFDIPVVGLNTIKNLVRAKAACLAIEAEKTLFIDREASLKLAEKKNLAVVAV